MSIGRFDPADRVIRVYARVEGPAGAFAHVRLIVDTGAAHVVLVPRVADWIGLGSQRASWPTERIASAHESRAHPRFDLPALVVLGHRVERVSCVEMELPLPIGADGLLGNSLLRHFRLDVDFPAGRLTLVRSSGDAMPIDPAAGGGAA